MIPWLIQSSLKLRFLIIVLALVIMGFGLSDLRKMPVDVYPEFDPPLVEVQTEALGLSAPEVEALITVPLEADLLNGVAWLDQIYSESVDGMSSILLVFEPGTDPIRARQMVQERLTQAFALPNVSSPPTMLQPLSTSSRVMMVGLSSKDLSLMEIGVLARWVIKPRLMGVPGVANVAIWGHRDRQLQVLVDPRKLEAHDVSLRQIIKTAGEALWVSPLSYLESSTPGTAGWIDTPNQRLSIRHDLPVASADDLAKVTVAGRPGLLLGSVAEVVEDHQPLIGDALLGDEPGLLLVIEKFPGANSLEVTRGVEEALEAMRPGLKGIDIDPAVFRPANYIEQASNNVGGALLVGLGLMALVFGLLFFHWRPTLISSLTVLLSLITAGLVLYLRGATFNVMTLVGFAIALGILIDDTVVDVENIIRHLRQNAQEGKGVPVSQVILKGAAEVRGALMFALLMLLLIVAPLFFVPGLRGAFFRPLAVSYILALIASLVVALVVTPALARTVLASLSSGGDESPLARKLQGVYQTLLYRLIRRPIAVMATSAALVLIGLVGLLVLDFSPIPTFKQTDMLVQWEAAPGTSRIEMNRIIAQVSRELRAVPGVRNVGAHVGRAITGDAIVNINSGEIWVSIEPQADYNATMAAIDEIISGYPGVFHRLETYQPKRTTEALMGTEYDLTVRVYGHDFPVLYEKAAEIKSLLADVPGVVAVETSRFKEEPQVEIEVDLPTAERYQIKPGDVRRQATTLLSGLRVGNLYQENKVFDVVVWGVPEIRDSLTDIRELPIHTPVGLVPLGKLADVRIVPSPVVIRRDVVSRFVDVGLRVDGRDPNTVAADIKTRLRKVDFPLEYRAEVLGLSPEHQSAQQRVIALAVAAVIGMVLLWQALSGSFRLAFAALATLPVALVGGVLAALPGGSLSLGVLFGLFALLGIAIRQGVVLVDRLRQLEESEGYAFGPDLVLHGAGERLVPLITTLLAMAAVLTPFIVLGDVAGNEILRPMSAVILGGLITILFLNAVVMPTMYLHFGSAHERAVTVPDSRPIPSN